MSEFRGVLVNAGDLTDLAASGPDLAADPSRLLRVPMPAFLAWAACRKATGAMAISDASGTVTDMILKDGAVQVLERRGHPMFKDVIADMVAEKELTQQAADQSAAMAVATGKSQVQVVYEMGACTPKALVDAIRRRKNGTLDALLATGEQPYAWVEGTPPGTKSDPVVIDLNTWLFSLVRHRTRMSYGLDMEPLLGDVLGKYPMKGPRFTPLILGTCVNEREKKTIDDLVDGTNATREVLTMSLMGRTQTARLLLACHLLGLLEYRTTPLPKGGVAALEAELHKTHERIQTEDLFTRLTIHWTTHPSLIKAAYDKMTERWGPSSPVRTQSATAAELADKIFALITEAYEGVAEQRRRRDYRTQLLGAAKMRFGTDLLYKQAHMALFRSEIPLARQIIEAAIDIIPDETYLDFHRKLGG
ncbi:MAG: hypothetical protein FJ087_06925 [Deltaproteobacteria bacterium]|nr:hypothetical protein [Deltaproteobacteria bacterium]